VYLWVRRKAGAQRCEKLLVTEIQVLWPNRRRRELEKAEDREGQVKRRLRKTGRAAEKVLSKL